MPSTKTKEPVLQLTISLSEVVQLQTENAALKLKVSELEEENATLKEQLDDRANSAKDAEAKKFRKQRGRA